MTFWWSAEGAVKRQGPYDTLLEAMVAAYSHLKENTEEDGHGPVGEEHPPASGA